MPYYQIILSILFVLAVLVWMKESKNPWALLGIAFIVGISIFSISFLQSRKSETSLRVVGYASKLFESDLVKWNISVQKSVSTSELKRGYNDMAADIAAFRAYLIEQGITDKDISIQPPTSYPMYDNYGNNTSYNINQSVFVLSHDLDKIDKLSLNAEFFANRGMLLQNSQLQYLYTKLPDLKKQLLAEATADAVARAQEISGSAQTGLGKLREARAGVFQITEPYSTDVSDYGIYNTSTRQKSISVTLTAIFGLR